MRIETLLLFIIAVFVAGCVSEIQSNKRTSAGELGRNTVIAVTNPQLPLPRGTLLSWYSDVIFVADPAAEVDQSLLPEIKQLVQAKMEGKGLLFAEGQDDGKYQVVVVAVIGEVHNLDTLKDLFKLYPDLALDRKRYTRGTLLLAVVDPQTHKAAWRGAIQAIADPEQPIDVRRKRLDEAVSRLLRSLSTTASAAS